jgi:hypothetical protein
VAATEHQRAGAKEGIGDGQRRFRCQPGEERQADQQREEQREPQNAGAAAQADRQRIVRGDGFGPQPQQADQGSGCNDADLRPGARQSQHDAGGERHQRHARRVGAQAARHAPHRLGDHRHGDDLEPVQCARRQQLAMAGKPEREQDHGERRGQREAGPGGQRAAVAVSGNADRHTHLAAGRSRQELAQRDQIGVSTLAEPAPAGDELVAEIAEMRDRAAERGQAQAQEDQEQIPEALTTPAGRRVDDSRRHGCPAASKRWLVKVEAVGRWIAMKP